MSTFDYISALKTSFFTFSANMTSSASSSDEEYTSLADKLKDKYVADIEATLKTIKRVEEISQGTGFEFKTLKLQ